MLTVFVALAASAVGAAIVARHRAQAAADLAALGGAALAVQGEQAACARAATLVADNGGGIVSCHLDGWDLMVAAEVVPSGVAAFAGAARASARAGPVADTMPTPVASGQPHQAGRVRLTDRVSAGPAPPRSTSFPPRLVRFVTAETLAS
jgi:secretion/DNA translocation related TadE-like protein